MKPTPLLTKSKTPIQTPKIPLSCPTLTTFLSGGIPTNSITEIVAESGCGKTQLCLNLLLTTQLPSLSSSSIYLHTEFPFPFTRLSRLSTSFTTFHNTPLGYNPLDNVFVQGVHDVDHLFDVLLKLESFLIRKRSFPVRLIVIDSVAAVFRVEFENNASEMKRRSGLFFKLSAILRGLAFKFGLAVVVTNQVVDFVEGSGGGGVNGVKIGNLGSLLSSGRRVCPALGLAWANCVNTRLFLSRKEEVLGENDGVVEEDGRSSVILRTRRFVHVVFAPHLAPSSCEFMILKEGVFGIDRTRQVVVSRIGQ